MKAHPNLVLITTDQQRFDTIHAAGNPHILTPHLDWLCDSGVRFTRTYADCPICVPARATIMNGRFGWRTGLINNQDTPRVIRPDRSLPGLLTAAGYQTRAIGKMHFVPERCHYGFEHMELLADYYRWMARLGKGVPMDHGLGQNELTPGIATVDESHSLTHWTAERGVDFLESRDDSRPFFLWLSFAKPHPPLDPCLPYWELYRGRGMPAPLRGDWSAAPDGPPPAFRFTDWLLSNADRFSEDILADIRRAYYACITQIDYNLGLFIARLRELSLLDDTVILFTSDHGEMLGDHRLGAKGVFFEGAAHVPMLLRGPERLLPRAALRGTTCDTIATLADVYATVLAAAGVPVPADYPHDGLDLAAVARGDVPPRTRLIGQIGSQHMVLDAQTKYCFSELGGAELLFDLAADPGESRDIARCPAWADRLASLRQILIARLGPDHPAVRDGRLVATAPEPDARDLRSGWPGFHHRHAANEVCH